MKARERTRLGRTRLDVTRLGLGIQFPLGLPAVSCIVVGCRSAAQLDESIGMFEAEIP